RTHVGDQAHCAAPQVYAFIELLGNAHGALRGEPKLARGLLLQRRGGEWRGWIAAALLFLYAGNAQLALRGIQQGLLDLARALLVLYAELLEPLAAEAVQPGRELLPGLVQIR